MTQENALPLGDTPDDDAHSITIELEAHDVSRFEWCVAVPLPAQESLKYTVEAEFELPSISISSPSPWDQLQGFTRLEEPQMVSASDDNASVNLLRQQVLVLQQMLQRARQGVLRHCRIVCEQPGDEAAVESLITWLNMAFRALATARARAVASKVNDSAEIVRERGLADEFISVRLIDFVADAEAMVDETLLVIADVDVRFRPSLGVVDEHLVRALDAELKYREAKGYLIADADSSISLEQFVERSGRLKKHFEAVLALDREAHPADERLHIWFTCLAALIGGACAFVPADLFGEVVVSRDGGLGIGGPHSADGGNLRDARSHQGGLPPLVGSARLSLVRSEGGALLHAGLPRLVEGDDRPGSGMVQRNHHLAARSTQSGKRSHAAGNVDQPRPPGGHRAPAATCGVRSPPRPATIPL